MRFFTSLREITGKREDVLRFSDDETVTVDKILKILSQKYGERFVEYVYAKETGEVRGFLQFLIDGKNAPAQNRLQAELRDGDVLAIIPPVGGG